MQRNDYAGNCTSCGTPLRDSEGIKQAAETARGYEILCLECAPSGALTPPKPPEASKLRSIHLDDEAWFQKRTHSRTDGDSSDLTGRV